ncbi:MAG: hypothetical protein QOI36_299 [Pseudonocardiales bacterium]|jgi:hypothetical protein|nr:hypothetical protein [Pseudonocardia sp.]MDT7648893.1 hypothetical protein [Pseudonocardiales bacterium]
MGRATGNQRLLLSIFLQASCPGPPSCDPELVRDPGINAAVNAAMGAIRLIIEEREDAARGAGNNVVAVIRELADKHGPRAVEITALFLAQAAASGFQAVARIEEDSVENVVAHYQQHFETRLDFTLLTAQLRDEE